jgi:hypothetical protein
MSTELLQPPDLRPWQEELAAARERRQEDARIAAMQELLAGKGAFWSDVYDSIYEAVRRGLEDDCSAELFRLRVLAAVASEGLRYAAAVAEDTD